MADFSSTGFLNVLPDPNNTIDYAGSPGTNTGYGGGPGYSSVQLTSEQKTLRDRTNSGRILARARVAHQWKIAIKYNPLTRAEFERVYNFIIHRRGPLSPFFVSLPQYRVPQDTTFASYAASNNLEADAAGAAGANSIMIEKANYGSISNKTPLPGDLFTISGSNSNHKKAYMLTRVETYADYNGSPRPAITQLRIHFTPGLAKAVGAGDDFVFHNPLIKVIPSSDAQQYSLNTNGLYQYCLNLEEVQ